MTLGTTSRNGSEFEFRKISLSLDRDLVPAENPIDAYRDIKALLERMVTEFQGGKPGARGHQDAKTQQSSNETKPIPSSHTEKEVPKSQQTGTGTPRVETPKPAGLTVETLRERLGKRLQDLDITDGFDGFSVKPKRFLGESWKDVNDVVRSLGGKWVKGTKPADGAWRIPK
jgi:hypothetical protein